MKCSQVRELMGAYLYGDLSPEHMRAVRLHANRCPECYEDLRSRSAALASISNKLPELSDADRQRIAWTVEGAIRRRSECAQPGLRVALALGGVAAAAAGIVMASVLLTHPPSRRANNIRAVTRRTPAIVRVELAKEQAEPSTKDEFVNSAKPRKKAEESEALRTVADAVTSAIRHGSGVAVSRHTHKSVRKVSVPDSRPAEDVRTVEENQDATNENPVRLPEVLGPNDARTAPADISE